MPCKVSRSDRRGMDTHSTNHSGRDAAHPWGTLRPRPNCYRLRGPIRGDTDPLLTFIELECETCYRCCAASRASGAVRVLLHLWTRLGALLLVRTGLRPLWARRRSGHVTHAPLALLLVAIAPCWAARRAASSFSRHATQSSIEPRVCRTRREGARRHSAQLGRNARYALFMLPNGSHYFTTE